MTSDDTARLLGNVDGSNSTPSTADLPDRGGVTVTDHTATSELTTQDGPAISRTPVPGERIGRYHVLHELGRGGMGQVFAAHDTSLDRLVALKFITLDAPGTLARFVSEARATARCAHPNIVVVHEIGQHGEAPYLVLEHLRGETLADRLARGKVPLDEIVSLLLGVARALECAHSRGIVHRDLKPANIFIAEDGTCKVLDFGIAAIAQYADAKAPRRRVMGTLRYMAPEQLAGEQTDARTDLWAFGVVLHLLLTGTRPHDELDDDAFRAQLLDRHHLVGASTAELLEAPPSLLRLLERCLVRPPARRCSSASEVVATLQSLRRSDALHLHLWLATGPSPADCERVAVGLVAALAAHEGQERSALGARLNRPRVHSDGTVVFDVGSEDAPADTPLRAPELADRSPPTRAGDVYAICALAEMALNASPSLRTPAEQRRADRIASLLARGRRATPRSRPSARSLDRALARDRHPLWRRYISAMALLAAALGIAIVLNAQMSTFTSEPIQAELARVDELDATMRRLYDADGKSDADQIFERFVAAPENRQVRTLAWLRRAELEAGRAQFAQALNSYGAAYLASTEPTLERRALEGVASIHLATHDLVGVERVVVQLRKGLSGNLYRHFVLEDHIALGARSQRALAAATPIVAAAARAFLQGSELAGAPRDAITVDLDRDGRPELLAMEDKEITAWRLGITPSRLWRYDGSASQRLCAVQDDAGALLVLSGVTSRILRVDGRGAVEELDLRGPTTACALLDIDGDGWVELYVGRAGARVLERYAPKAGERWHRTEYSLGSELHAILGVDLDMDGQRELALAVGEWRAYDVRIVRPGAHELELLDRIRLGVVGALEPTTFADGSPGLLAVVDPMFPSVKALPAAFSAGAPSGVYWLAFRTGRLTLERFVAGQGMYPSLGPIWSRDLDLDGVTELVGGIQIAEQPALGVVTVGRALHAVVRGIRPLTFAQLDDDPESELVAVVDGPKGPRLWVLGAGTSPLPELASASIAPLQPSTSAAPGWTLDLWRRAELLAALGITNGAVTTFAQIARASEGETRRRAIANVVAIQQGVGADAGADLERLANATTTGSPERTKTLVEAARLYADELDLESLRRVLAELERADGPRLGTLEADEIRALSDRLLSPVLDLFDGGPLGPAWELIDPTGLRYAPLARTLELTTFDDITSARVELERTTGAIELQLRGTVTRSEWDAGFGIQLVPDGYPSVFVAIRGRGGGGAYHLIASVVTGTKDSVVDHPVCMLPIDGTRSPQRLELSILIVPDARRMRIACALGVRHGVSEFPIDHALETVARWNLEFRGATSPRPSPASTTAMSVALTRIAVAGLAPRQSRIVSAHSNLLRDVVNRATSGPLLAHGWLAPSVELLIALRLDDGAAAAAASISLRRSLGRERWLASLARLARLNDGAHVATVTTLAGNSAPEVLWRAYSSLGYAHGGEEAVRQDLERALRTSEVVRPGRFGSELLRLRGAARLDSGDLVGARRDLDLSDRLTRGADLTTRLLLAEIAARDLGPQHALRVVQKTLKDSPWPEAFADLVLLSDHLRPLAHGPGWESVRTLGRALALPPRGLLPTAEVPELWGWQR